MVSPGINAKSNFYEIKVGFHNEALLHIFGNMKYFDLAVVTFIYMRKNTKAIFLLKLSIWSEQNCWTLTYFFLFFCSLQFYKHSLIRTFIGCLRNYRQSVLYLWMSVFGRLRDLQYSLYICRNIWNPQYLDLSVVEWSLAKHFPVAFVNVL